MHYIIYFGKIQHCILNFGLKIVHISLDGTDQIGEIVDEIKPS